MSRKISEKYCGEDVCGETICNNCEGSGCWTCGSKGRLIVVQEYWLEWIEQDDGTITKESTDRFTYRKMEKS